MRIRESASLPGNKEKRILASLKTWDKRGRSEKRIFEFDCANCGKHRSFLLSPARYRAKLGRTKHHTCSPKCRAEYSMAHFCTHDTKPELQVKAYLIRAGIKFQPQQVIEFDSPVLGQKWTVVDFLIEGKTIIYVDGCYFHGCNKCGLPGIKNNMVKDPLITQKLISMGYRVIRIKEHELSSPTWQDAVLAKISVVLPK
jgi:G:T-mismatch repair DNA endonuclease (very short patch repair protein)